MIRMVENGEYGSQVTARWMLLVCISLVTMGIMYCNDTPPAIAPYIFDAFEDIYSKKEFEYYYNTLCSLVSVPNLIFPLFAGVLIDTISLYHLSVILISFLIVGQLVITVGFGMKNLAMMLAGRCIFGFGSESSLIAFNSLLIRYFPEWEVALALSICLAIGRIGSVLSDMVSPIIATLFPVYWTFLFGLVLLVVGGLSVLANLKKYYKDDLSKSNPNSAFSVVNNIKSSTNSQAELISHNDILNSSNSNVNPIFDSIGLNVIKSKTALIWRKIHGLGKLYWYLSLLGLLSYSVIMPFNYIAGPLIVETQYKDVPASTARQYAGIIMSLLYAVSVLVLPLLGWIVDRVGERCKLLTISVGLLALAHALMLKLHPAISITILGLGYTLFATVYWPCISISVPQNLLGTALGVVTCIQNLGFIITPIQVAFLHSNFKSYVVVESFFLAISVLALIVCYIVYRIDTELCGKLDSAPPGNATNLTNTYKLGKVNDIENVVQGCHSSVSSDRTSKIRLEELIFHKYISYNGNSNGALYQNRKLISSSSISTFDDSDESYSCSSSIKDDDSSFNNSYRKSSSFLRNNNILPLANYSVSQRTNNISAIGSLSSDVTLRDNGNSNKHKNLNAIII